MSTQNKFKKRMPIKNLNLIFLTAIKKLVNGCLSSKDRAMYFFKESDLKCALVHELFCTQQANYLLDNNFRLYKDNGKEYIGRPENFRATSVLTEVKYGKRLQIGRNWKDKKNFFDIVVIHPDCISFGTKPTSKLRKSNEVDSYSINKDKNNVYAQLKFKWGNRSKDRVKNIIYGDKKTLSAVKSNNRYIIYWEYNNIKKNSVELKDIKDKFGGKKYKLHVVYINGFTKKVYCNSKWLQNKIKKIK